MAKSSFLILLVLALSCFTQLALAARKVPAAPSTVNKTGAAADVAAASDKEAVKQPETLQEGTVLIPGIGRYMVGSNQFPDIPGLDHSIPAAVNSQYLPGADDTFVPNPGFEIPNPFRPSSP